MSITTELDMDISYDIRIILGFELIPDHGFSGTGYPITAKDMPILFYGVTISPFAERFKT